MSITIRLSRIGRKNQPSYKLVVSNTRDKRNGRSVDIIGHFNPTSATNSFSYDKEKYEMWAKRGALITEAVKKLIEKKYEYVKYEPKKALKKDGEDTETAVQPKEQIEDKKEEKEKDKEEKIEEKGEEKNEDETPVDETKKEIEDTKEEKKEKEPEEEKKD